jgi:hypothetical protein
MKNLAAGVLCLLSGALTAGAQPQVDAKNLHERIVAVVPLTGAGTYADPKRPAFVPAGAAGAGTAAGWVSWSWQPTDDGKMAIVELAARNPAAIREVLRDARIVAAFEKRKAKRGDVEREIRKYRKDFSLDGPAAPGRSR